MQIIASALWFENLLLGYVATSIAIVAIGAAGFGMLGGRLDVRKGALIVFGCFLLFGAPAIASGLLHVLGRSDERVDSVPSPVPPAITQPPSTNPFDPYTGRTVTQSR